MYNICVVQDFLDKRQVSGSELFLAVPEYMISNATFSTHFAHRLGKKVKNLQHLFITVWARRRNKSHYSAEYEQILSVYQVSTAQRISPTSP